MDPALSALAATLWQRPELRRLTEGPVDLPAGLLAYAARAPQQPEHRIYRPVLTLVLQGQKRIRHDGRELILAPGMTFAVGIDMVVTSRVTEAPYLALSVIPDAATLRELAAPGDLGADGQTDAEEADWMMAGAMLRLGQLIDRPGAMAALRPGLMREVHFWALHGPHGAMLRRTAGGDGAAARIAGAIAAIRSDPARPVRVPDLARDAGMSLSTFHARFREMTATTPVQFQKRLRLIDARLRLQSGAAVSEAAFAVGYESPTQFARDFRRTFGTAPSQTRRAAGLASGAASGPDIP
jgi:AraC-like DNA-binding protein